MAANVKQPPYNAVGDGVADDTAAIQNAINACPAGQFVYIPAGTYKINALTDRRNDITIRGAGMGQTVLMMYGGGNGALDFGSGDWPRPTADRDVVSGATAGNNTITVSSTAGIAPGKLIRLEQTDPTWVKSPYGTKNNVGLIFKVTATTATTITFFPSLPFALTNSPKLAVYSNPLIQNVGLEDLKIDMTNSGAGSAVFVEQAFGCWIKSVEVYHSNTRQLWFLWAMNCEVRECYVHDMRSSGPDHEGIDFYENGCWNLVEDNTCIKGGWPMIVLGDYKGGSSGNVVAYNYCENIDTGTSDAGAAISTNHGPHNMMNLFEGNISGGFQSDGWHGSASHTTLLRNWFTATHPTLTSNLKAINLNRWSNYFNVVGNILGTPSFPGSPNGVYDSNSSYGSQVRMIWQLGFPNIGNNNYSGTLNATNPPDYTNQPTDYQQLDLNVRNTLLRHGNYDYSTRAIQWDSGVADRNIPNSYYLSTKPAWFNNLPWPPFDPSNPSAAKASSIPAGYRYIYGVDPPGGSVTLTRSGNDVVINFPTAQGTHYRVEQTPNLKAWTTLADNIPGTGQTATVVDAGGATATRKCYRVLLLP